MNHHLTAALAHARLADLHRDAKLRKERAAPPAPASARPRHARGIDPGLQIGGRRWDRRGAA
jgi:hypothetical protein